MNKFNDVLQSARAKALEQQESAEAARKEWIEDLKQVALEADADLDRRKRRKRRVQVHRMDSFLDLSDLEVINP